MFAPVPKLRTLCALAGFIVWGCASAPELVPEAVQPASAEEREVIAVLDAVERSVERHDLAGVLRQVSVYYRDGRGNNFKKVQMFLERMFSDYGTIDIQRSETSVTVQNTHAEVRERFVTRATPRSGTGVPAIEGGGPVVIRLEQVAGDWLITEWVATAGR